MKVQIIFNRQRILLTNTRNQIRQEKKFEFCSSIEFLPSIITYGHVNELESSTFKSWTCVKEAKSVMVTCSGGLKSSRRKCMHSSRKLMVPDPSRSSFCPNRHPTETNELSRAGFGSNDWLFGDRDVTGAHGSLP